MTFHQGLTRPQGDPGFFGTLGRIVGGIARRIPGPIGLVAGTILGRGARPVPRQAAPMVQAPTIGQRITRIGQIAVPGGRTGFECPPGMACPKGMRLNKSDYFLKNGTFIAAGTRCVSIRRTNPANVRALRRSIRREEAFIRLAKRTGLVALPKARRVRKAARK